MKAKLSLAQVRVLRALGEPGRWLNIAQTGNGKGNTKALGGYPAGRAYLAELDKEAPWGRET